MTTSLNGTKVAFLGHKLADDDSSGCPGWRQWTWCERASAGVRWVASTPRDELYRPFVVEVFRSKLPQSLVLTCRALPVLEDDQRLVNLLQNLDKRSWARTLVPIRAVTA